MNKQTSAAWRLLLDDTETERSALELFLRERYRAAFDARLRHFLPSLIGISDAGGRVLAAGGLALAADSPGLFLEGYLGSSVERALSAAVGKEIPRDQITEIGNLAARRAGAGVWTIAALCHEAEVSGCTWGVFTGTRDVRGLLKGLRLHFLELAVADENCVDAEPGEWGSYYQSQPVVCAAQIEEFLAIAFRRWPALAELLRHEHACRNECAA